MPRGKSLPPIKQGERALLAARRRLAQTKANKQAKGSLTPRQRAVFAREMERATTAELRAQLEMLRAAGLYDVKLEAGESLDFTRGRKQRVRKAYKQLEALASGAVFARYPSVKPAEKRRLAAAVKAQGGTVTRAGVFLPREEGEMKAGDTRLIREKDTGLYKIRQVNRYTDKAGHRRTVTADLYIEGAAALERQEAKLKRNFDKLATGLAPNERIRFTIGGPMGNVSRASFSSWESFKRYAMAYRRDPRAQATFLASLTVYIARKESPRATRYRVPVAWVDPRGTRRDADPANLYGGDLFPLPKRDRSKSAKRRKRTK